MKKLYLFLSVCLLFSAFKMHSQAPSWDWAKNSAGNNFDSNSSTATDSDGNVYVAGVFQSTTITFGNITLTNLGSKDAFIVKYSSSGDVIWAKNIGGTFEEQIMGITTDNNNNVYITGDFESSLLTIDNVVLTNTNNLQDMFVAKLDSNGTALWAKSASGTSYDYGFSVTVDNSGNVFVGGQFISPNLTFGGITVFNVESTQLDHDVFISKLDSTGNVLWVKSAGGTGFEALDSMATDAAGNLYASGIFYSPTITFGSTVITNTNNYGDIYIVKYDSTGVLQWARKCGGANYETVRDIKTDSQGNLFVAGHFESASMTLGTTILNNAGSNSTDIFLAKYSSDGALLWAKRAGGISADIGTGIAVDNNNNAYLTGSIASNNVVFGNLPSITTNGDYDVFVTKYDSSGNAVWSRNSGGVGYDLAANTSMDSNNNLYVSGVTTSPQIDFDNHIINMSSYSIFTAKMNSATLGVESFQNKSFSVFPNPVSDLLSIKSNIVLTDNQYEIFDLDGRIIAEGTINQDLSQINVSYLQQGIYFLRHNNESIKFIKK